MPTPSAAPRSIHRHISFTAHYTSAIWHRLGISHPRLVTRRGRLLVSVLRPLEAIAERVVGGSMRSTLKQRHTQLDRWLDELIAQYPNAQVLEVAAGLSPRGWRYRQRYPHLTYVEADLPDMAVAKRTALLGLEVPSPRIEAVDLFTPQLAQLFESFDGQAPLIIVSEGLVNYFSKPMLADLWLHLGDGLRQFPQGFYLTDLYPEPSRLARFVWGASKVLKHLSRSSLGFHFHSPPEAQAAFRQAGFNTVEVWQPHFDTHPNPDITQHYGDLVWAIKGQV